MATATANPPIYQLLVEEHGDVLAATRDAVRETQRAANAALDWSDLRRDRRAPERVGAAPSGDGTRDRARPEREPVREHGTTSGNGTPEAGTESEPGTEPGTEAGAEAGAEAGWFDRPEQAEAAGRPDQPPAVHGSGGEAPQERLTTSGR